MPLKFILDNLDDVKSDKIKALYIEKDGKFVLDVEGAESTESVNGLKTALVKERENVAAYKKLGTPDEITQTIADLKSKGKGNPDHEQLVADLKTAHATELQTKDDTINGMRKDTSLAVVKAELSAAGVIPEGLDLMADHAMHRVKFNEDGTPKVLSKDGVAPMIGSGADGGATLADLAKELAGTIPHLVKDDGRGGGGKPPSDKGGKPANQTKLADKVPGLSDLPVS